MRSTRPSLQRLVQLMKRQGGEQRWGKDYLPANRVNTREAPSCSRPSCILAPKLGGRYVLTQSKAERAAALLALYHPEVFEIHEQKLLHVDPRPHPLATHPSAVGLDLPPLKGTVSVADRLGCLARHPVVRMPSETNPNEIHLVPFPFVGDLLLYLADDIGPYCVNWTIKKSGEDFQRRMATKRPRAKDAPPDKGELQRHEIEETYYIDGMIPTYRITLDEIDENVRINLLNLQYWHARSPVNPVDPVKQERILSDYEKGIGSGFVQYELAKRASKDHSIDVYTTKLILKQGIWSRRLRVDLFGPLLDDLPLYIESRDVLDVYSSWFARRAP